MTTTQAPAGGKRAIAPLYEQLRAFDIIDEWIHEHAEDIEAAGGELPPELQQLLDHVGQDFDDKVERCGLKVQADKAEAIAIDEEIKRLTARKKAIENRVERIRRYMTFCMAQADRPKVKGLLVTVTLRNASQPTITVEKPEALPPEMQKLIPARVEADRLAILARWKADRQAQTEAIDAGLNGGDSMVSGDPEEPLFPPAAGVRITLTQYPDIR